MRLIDDSPTANIDRRVYIGVGGESARCTGEFALRLAIGSRDMSTLGTHLAGVSRVNGNKFDTSKKCFVFQFESQIIEAPRMVNSPLAFLNPYPVTDALEVFDGDTASGAFSLFNNLFGDAVIYVSLESGFLALTFFQKAFSRFRAFSLELSSEACISGSDVVEFATRERLSITGGSNIDDPKINTEIVVWFALWRLWNFDANIEVKDAITINKVGLTSDALHVNGSIVAKYKRDVNSVGQGFKIDNVSFLEFPYSMVVNDCSVFSELVMLLFVSLIGFFNLAYGADGKLGGQPKLLSDVIVAKLVQRYLVRYLALMRYIRDVVTGGVEGFHSSKKLLLLLFCCL